MQRTSGVAAWWVVCGVMAVASAAAHGQGEVELASGGEARLAVVVGPGAADATRATAAEFADYLGRISGATFEVTEGDGSGGIVVGVPGDFDALPFDVSFGDGPFERDHYRLRSTGSGLYLIGATPLAAEFAVWDVLYRFGHRQFFPSATWEVVPSADRLALGVDEYQRPSYYNRSGPRGALRMAHRPWAEEAWRRWRVRNRTTPSFTLHTGHAYLGLVNRNRAHFDANPEFYAKINGERRNRGGNEKMCIGNEDLRRFIVNDAIERLAASPDADSISMDPSDGGGWCECDLCAAVGTPSDLAVLLANDVAEALHEEFGRPIYVGIYGYNEHSPPPTLDVHPHVIVSLATAFIRGDQTFDDMLEGWSEKAELIGVREFYGVMEWNAAQPGRARAANLDYMTRTIPDFHAKGARFMNSQSDDAWGPNGLGYYLAARLQWDVAEPGDALIDDFLDKAFGPARETMADFYDLITAPPQPLLSEHLVGRMYRLLAEARSEATGRPDVLARIDDLILYARFVELDRVYSAARGAERQQPLDELMAFAWRIRERMITESTGQLAYLNRTVRGTDDLEWGEGYTATLPPTRMRERENDPVDEAELLAILEAGIANNQPLDFEPADFSDELEPADALGLEGARLSRNTRTRGRFETYTWVDRAPATIRLEVTTGLTYDTRGPARVALEVWDDDHADYEPIQRVEVPPDQRAHEVVLEPRQPGRHRIVIDERMSGTSVSWPDDLRRTTPSSMTRSVTYIGRDNWYFYVPRGTTTVGAYASARGGRMLDADGNEVFSFEGETYNDYLSIPVPPGQDGRLWSVRGLAGDVRLLTVPAYGAASPRDLLLPREVIEADTAR